MNRPDEIELIVPDTSFLVSALLFDGSRPSLCLKVAQRNGILLCSVDTLAELTEVFGRKKFDSFVSQETRMGMLYDLRRSMQLVEVSEHIQECRDPGDDKFLSLALAGNASVIITGDDDLLVLHPFRNIAILSAFDYLMS